jgi:hypothetical protein
VIDIGYHTFNIRCRSGRPLLGNFREGSRKVQKIGVGRYQQFRPVNVTPAILYDTFQIIVIDVGCLTNNRRYNSGCRLLGNFQEGSRKVLKFDTLVFQYNNAYFVFHLYGTPFCIDAALMEMSMAIILYQCIATTQCQLSLFGQAKVLLSTTTPILFSICMARLFCIDAALMEMSMAIILYQCIATTQCQLSLFGQAKV